MLKVILLLFSLTTITSFTLDKISKRNNIKWEKNKIPFEYEWNNSIHLYYPDFYLNFGNNELIIANNVAYSEDPDTGESTLLIKLYEPLPEAYDIKSELWLVDKVAESVSFNVDFQKILKTLDKKRHGINVNIGFRTKLGMIAESLGMQDMICRGSGTKKRKKILPTNLTSDKLNDVKPKKKEH